MKHIKELVPMNDYGLFADGKEIARVDSRFVAEAFGKRHDNVVRDIEKIIEPKSGLSEEFIALNFEEINYADGRNRKQKAYALTRDGFTILVMGYTGKKAMRFKELYIRQFNEMEEFIKTLIAAKDEFPALTENIRLLHDEPKAYHFSNECNMINKIVLGMSTKEFREENGIAKGESIRPYLTNDQIEMLDRLQRVDVGLLVAFPDYQERKKHLEEYREKIEEDKKKRICEVA
ncbi:MAG: Rha family transcriptional regulator [Finegoldia sp.]|nr:Rha family transcriptional regulator [Finegoldia sp.]